MYRILLVDDEILVRDAIKENIDWKSMDCELVGDCENGKQAAEFVQVIEQRQGIMISAPEEIAYRHGWITREELLKSADTYGKSPYGDHLHRVADGKIRY